MDLMIMSWKRKILNNGLSGVVRHLGAMLFVFLPAVVAAQGLEVSKPLTLTARQEAVQYERFDYNLNLCAMVVVYLDDDNVDFQGDVRTQQYRGNGEWWVWMIQGANWLSVTIPNYTPLRMEFSPLASGKTYEVHIRPAAPKLLLTVTEPFHQDMSRTDASKYSRLDAQGRTCALVRIGLVLPEAKFTGAVHSRYLNSEWMVWLSPGTTSLGISAQGYQPLTVQFEPVQAAATYLMTVFKAGEAVAQQKTSTAAKQAPATKAATASQGTPAPTGTTSVDSDKARLLVESGIKNCRRFYYKKAYSEFYEAAKMGDMEGCYQLGMLYRNDNYEGANLERAVEWLTRAADMGHADAMYQIGEIYLGRDNAKAKQWFKKAAAKGHEKAAGRVSKMK